MSRWIAALTAAVLAAGVLARADPAPGSVEAGIGHRAEATAVGSNALARGRSDAEPSDIAAALAALAACAARRLELGIETPCEVVRLDDEAIPTGAAIRALVPRDNHPLFLWRLVSGPAELYLAGSVHALKATLYPLPEPFEAAFAKSDVLAVEVDIVSNRAPEDQEQALAEMLLPSGVTLESVIAPATLARLNGYLATQSIAPASLAMLKPVMIATQLSMSRLMALGYLPDYGLERHFIERAGDRRIIELETRRDQLKLLADPPMTLQEQLLNDTLDQLPELNRITSELMVAWLSGDATELRRLFEEQTAPSEAYEEFMDRLLGQRNRAMAERLESLLEEPGTYFVLVGAAHLTGSDGIVALLTGRGYDVEQLTSDATL